MSTPVAELASIAADLARASRRLDALWQRADWMLRMQLDAIYRRAPFNPALSPALARLAEQLAAEDEEARGIVEAVGAEGGRAV
jgi:hypothetical protein